MTDRKICAACGNVCLPIGCASGYGISPDGQIHCFDCCADLDRISMREKGYVTLYLQGTTFGAKYSVSNWPGSLRFSPTAVHVGKHNIAGQRVDVWFVFEGFFWHGVNIGDNQILRCKRTKRRAFDRSEVSVTK